jgi:hypothetical protein
MLEFLQNHWGLIAVIVITICYSLYDFEQFKRKIAALIFVRIKSRLVCKFLSYQ